MLSEELRDNFKHAKDEIEELQTLAPHAAHAETADKLTHHVTLTVVPSQTTPALFDGSVPVTLGVEIHLTDQPGSEDLPSTEQVSLLQMLSEVRNLLKWLKDTADDHETRLETLEA